MYNFTEFNDKFTKQSKEIVSKNGKCPDYICTECVLSNSNEGHFARCLSRKFSEDGKTSERFRYLLAKEYLEQRRKEMNGVIAVQSIVAESICEMRCVIALLKSGGIEHKGYGHINELMISINYNNDGLMTMRPDSNTIAGIVTEILNREHQTSWNFIYYSAKEILKNPSIIKGYKKERIELIINGQKVELSIESTQSILEAYKKSKK